MVLQTGPPTPFSSLPLNREKQDAWLNAWGLYGDEDERGFLNRVTDEMVANAAKGEIRTGKRVNLSLPLNFFGEKTLFNRKPFHQEVIHKGPRCVNDDVWTFNSQCTSQWDGLRHYAYQKPKRFYNNVSAAQILSPGDSSSSTSPEDTSNPTTSPTFIGVHNLASQGILGRGILVDFARWRDHILSDPSLSSTLPASEISELKSFEAFKPNPIRHNWLLSTLAHQSNTTPQYGDILLIRSGYLRTYLSLDTEQISSIVSQSPVPGCGVEQCTSTLRWTWETFSAVGSDHHAFEAWPGPCPGSEARRDADAGTGPGWTYHEVLLAGWGCPIGELFDLEELSQACEREGRWSFFVNSVPCNVPGGVASPPNILALF